MYKFVLSFLLAMTWSMSLHANSIKGLLERIDPGCSSKFIIEQKPSDTDYFELDQKGDKVVIRGNNYVSIATGINWYLKYYAGIHLSWNGMTAKLPQVLPPVLKKERRETTMSYRYDFNYCTFSYTMAFWDWERWQKEIDWMALHGINLPLAITGADAVWFNVLKKLGYTKEEINQFIAGPAFQAWWLMNNLEGWGGPNPDSWYEQQEALQKKIIKRMREFGIEPVLPGYSGMVPHNAKSRLGLDVKDPGLWCAYNRPAFLLPTDSRFEEIASLYYEEMNKLYGKANYYSMDPFHEGGNTDGVDLQAAGQAIMKQMKNNNPNAKWVIMTWQANPRPQLIETLKKGDLLIVDLFSESRPQWGEPQSTWARKNGFGQHEWLYGMLLNFGGNVGLHGKMEHVINSFYKAKNYPVFGEKLNGVALTMEGSENNPVMYELLTELPWRNEKFDKDTWLDNYTLARYGKECDEIKQSWRILSNSIYNAPVASTQQGTHESVFCARPSLNVYQVSSWSEMSDYYDPEEVIKAARLMLSVADQFKGNNNFEYDLVDVVRQAIAEKGRLVLKAIKASGQAGENAAYQQLTKRFLDLILLQDELLSTRPEFKVGTWIEMARKKGFTQEEKDLYEWNARVQITTWGNRTASEQGGLRDYAHREWSGMLRDVYYERWKTFFDSGMDPKIDYYAMDEAWTKQTNPYSLSSSDECVEVVKKIFDIVFGD
ncbi:alpha-N-acetylglucosaminidase [Parabacteroides faecis]|uniref:alpha-N-acetylglucosaminidase n=1 Tax=Parabacteroides faecis TaxID=1217282 RepID=UPI002164ACEA|nr:alpha-N-acetylglucosaminidase [Parabacteroides faecis]MCS2891682.1 alpha-N-acetylglucosaminidase [Parabacteroides faecis]UVQ44704.1 alpha-N-acetylglucosaminidase [Parabacteroides faecis]